MNSVAIRAPGAARPRWNEVDLVLLDMDGTLLDLRFDNYFWLELVPQRFAVAHGLTLETTRQLLSSRFAAKQGTLDWYCTDFWSRELALDIAALKREIRDHIAFLPGAEGFLRELRTKGIRAVLVTNAHEDSLSIKAEQTGLTRYMERAISSHAYGVPKEHPEFWRRLQSELGFDPARALFVDDSPAVLRAARAHGIAQIFAIARPDSTQPLRQLEDFATVAAVAELLEDPPQLDERTIPAE